MLKARTREVSTPRADQTASRGGARLEAPGDGVQELREQSDDPVLLATDRLLRRKLKDVARPVFFHRNRRMTRREANRAFAAYRDRAGLSSSYGPHSLRHTCGTELLEQGVNLRVVQEILGHAHVTTTELYTQVRRGPKAKAMRLLPSTPLVLTQHGVSQQRGISK